MSAEKLHFGHFVVVFKETIFELRFYNTFAILLQFSKKISLKSDFTNILMNIQNVHVYSPVGGADNPLETKFLRLRKGNTFCPFVEGFQTFSLNSYFKHIFHALIHVYSPRIWAYNPM